MHTAQRIALVTSSSISPAMEAYIAALARILCDAHYDVDLVTPLTEHRLLPALREIGVNVRQYHDCHSDDMLRRAFRLGRQLTRQAYNVIFVHNVPLLQAVAGLFPDTTFIISVLHRPPFSSPNTGEIQVNACNVRVATDPALQQLALTRIPTRPCVAITADDPDAMREGVMTLLAQAKQGAYALPWPRHTQPPVDLAAFNTHCTQQGVLQHTWRERQMPERPLNPAYPATAPKSVLLTGATGQLGAAICRELVMHGVRVGVLLRPGSDCRRIHDLLPQLRVFPGTLETIAKHTDLITAFAPEGLVHLAWIAGQDGKSADLASLEANLLGTVALLTLMQRAGCRYVLGAGSAWESAVEWPNMALQDTLAIPSPRFALYNQTGFAVAKSIVGKAVQNYCACSDMECCWLRPHALYGPAGHEDSLIARATRQRQAGGSFSTPHPSRRWDLLHVRDAAQAFLTALTQGITGVYELASGETVSEAELLGLLGHPALPEQMDETTTLPPLPPVDGTPFRTVSGWSASTSLREGILSTAAWWASQETTS